MVPDGASCRDPFAFGGDGVERHVPRIGWNRRDLLHAPRDADPARTGPGGEGAVVMARALAQAVERAVERHQRGQHDIGGERLGIGGRLAQAEWAAAQRRVRIPAQEAQRRRAVDD
ncbi:hypothetical protein LTR94_034340, partial [Friedmanniomyces endolithicus]